MVDDNTWPLEQPTSFTPSLLIHYTGSCTPEQVTAMAELMSTGDIDKVATITGEQSSVKYKKLLDTSTATKEIKEILAPLEKSTTKKFFILIEGAPGIGKSVLLKEISYRWDNKELLQKFELVLLVCLRDCQDPSLQQAQSVDDLLQLFCMGDKNATQIVSACAQYNTSLLMAGKL